MSDSANDLEDVGIIARPQAHLLGFPVSLRWEITRRHPYYLAFWEEARRYHRGEADDLSLGYVASLLLSAIGVSGEPVSPDKDFDQLSDADPAFLCGCVQPISLRAMVAMLINTLPVAERVVVGAILTASRPEEGENPGSDEADFAQKQYALDQLRRTPSPALDCCTDAPLYYIHLEASQRSIERDLEDQVRRQKKRRGLPERRVHTAKLESYLKVWDLREGWENGAYDRTREQSLLQIGKKVRASQSTVESRYRAAFQMITGHEFSTTLWLRLWRAFKFTGSTDAANATPFVPVRRRLQTPVARPLPDSVVSPAVREHTTGIVEGKSARWDDQALVDLQLDAQELIEKGMSDQEIANRLELDVDAMAYFRERVQEFHTQKRHASR